jgi:hypothetical protein
MSMRMANAIDTSDPMLVSDEERAVILAPAPKPNTWLYDFEPAADMTFRYSSEVRKRARQLRNAELQRSINDAGRLAA